MNKKTLYALGALMLTFSAVGCGSSTSSGTGGAGGKAPGTGGSGATTVPTVPSACKSYCDMFPASCPACGSLSPVLTACIKFCIAERGCASGGIENSMDYRCIQVANAGGGSLDSLTTECKAANVDWFDCLANQSMVCAGSMANLPGACTTQATALAAACNK